MQSQVDPQLLPYKASSLSSWKICIVHTSLFSHPPSLPLSLLPALSPSIPFLLSLSLSPPLSFSPSLSLLLSVPPPVPTPTPSLSPEHKRGNSSQMPFCFVGILNLFLRGSEAATWLVWTFDSHPPPSPTPTGLALHAMGRQWNLGP